MRDPRHHRARGPRTGRRHAPPGLRRRAPGGHPRRGGRRDRPRRQRHRDRRLRLVEPERVARLARLLLGRREPSRAQLRQHARPHPLPRQRGPPAVAGLAGHQGPELLRRGAQPHLQRRRPARQGPAADGRRDPGALRLLRVPRRQHPGRRRPGLAEPGGPARPAGGHHHDRHPRPGARRLRPLRLRLPGRPPGDGLRGQRHHQGLRQLHRGHLEHLRRTEEGHRRPGRRPARGHLLLDDHLQRPVVRRQAPRRRPGGRHHRRLRRLHRRARVRQRLAVCQRRQPRP